MESFTAFCFGEMSKREKPSNVIHLPTDYKLANGWTSQELRRYCREYIEALRKDEGYER